MTSSTIRACLMLPAALFITVTSGADAKPRKTPKGTVLCLPPGSSKPMPCAAAAAGSTIQVHAAGSAPAEIHFVEVGGGGRRASVPIRPVVGHDGSYLITVPRHLCTKDRLGNFEIQRLMSSYNQAEAGPSQTLGTLAISC